MGPLALPAAGLVYIDANGLIYSVERVEPYRTLLEPMWQQAQDENLSIGRSPVLVTEVLVKPLQVGNTEIEMQYRELFASNAVSLLDAPYGVFEDARRYPRRNSYSGRLCTLHHQRYRLPPRPGTAYRRS